jgi:predicted CoA-binding protein
METEPERAIIIVGASPRRSRFSNKAVRAYRELGWIVYPIHPVVETIEGLRCYPRISDVPGRAETLNLYVRPATGLALVEEAPAKGVRKVFVNPGAGSPELVRRIEELGMKALEACSIVAVGKSPGQYPD